LASNAPILVSLQATFLDENDWLFTGTVSDEFYVGLTVVFGGLLSGQSCVVGTGGAFSFLFELGEEDNGGVTAQTADWWGLASNVIEVYVDNRV
jgi:hypothetical protein